MPPILPFVFYHGKNKWQVGLSFQDLIDMPAALKPYVLQSYYQVYDLSDLSDAEIIGQVYLRARLLLLTRKYQGFLPATTKRRACRSRLDVIGQVIEVSGTDDDGMETQISQSESAAQFLQRFRHLRVKHPRGMWKCWKNLACLPPVLI